MPDPVAPPKAPARRRPLWRRAASRARSACYRLITPIERIARGRGGRLLPPAHLRLYYYRSLSLEVFDRVCAGARDELVSRGLRPEHRVLDIGSGIGNLAIALTGYLQGGYDGLEIHREAAAWCQRAITPRHPAFRFHHADLQSHAYNADGGLDSARYRFPFSDRQFDFVFVGSVFTHMMPAGVEQYVREIARVLAPGGRCVVGYYLMNDETRAGVLDGRSFMSFQVAHPSGLCRFHDAAVPESAVAFEEAFVRRIHEQAGLQIEHVRRGRWWCGAAHEQDVLTAVLP